MGGTEKGPSGEELVRAEQPLHKKYDARVTGNSIGKV